MKRWTLLAILLIAALALAGCARKADDDEVFPNPIATITLSDGSQMQFELYPDIAPNTVANFVSLANKGFYDGQQIFRVVSNVLIQAGDPKNNGTGDPGYYIAGEFSENGFENGISHMRGTISLARKSDYDTGGSQFFIMEGSYPEYDGYYAAFGRILDDASLAVLDEIGSRPVDGNYEPLDHIVIQRIRVETFDAEYEPVTLSKDSVDNKEDRKKR